MSDPAFVPPSYELGRKLGSGQTSHVYLAVHPQFGEVALKLPREELHDQPVLRRMFENEVQITLGLRHRNLVAAMDGRPTGRNAFLTLEYCSGGTLDHLLLGGGLLDLEHAVRLIRDVAAGLQQSHVQQVLHRDVKPANVFLTEDGVAKLGDFGTGCFMTEENQDRVGTAFYMAPEILEGGVASVTSDVYSLGILAYEVLAGTRPFTGDTFEQIMYAHLSGLPKPLEYHRPGIARGVANVISRAMAREPARRYPSVGQFRTEFERGAGVVQDGAGGVTSGRGTRQANPDQARAGARASGDGGGKVGGKPAPGGQDDGKPRAGARRRGLFGLFRRK